MDATKEQGAHRHSTGSTVEVQAFVATRTDEVLDRVQLIYRMKEETPPRDIAAEGPAFATHIRTGRKHYVTTKREALLLLKYSKQIREFIRWGKCGMVIHKGEERISLNATDTAALMAEHRRVTMAVHNWQRRTGMRVTKGTQFRNIRKADPRYFDVGEYRRETKP